MCKGYKKDILGCFSYEFELLRFLSEAQGFTLRDAMLSHRDVAHFVRSDVMFGATRQRRASRTAGLHHARSVHHLPERANIVEKKHHLSGRQMVFLFWLGWQDSNLRMQQSKCCVLPLDDTPMGIKFIKF